MAFNATRTTRWLSLGLSLVISLLVAAGVLVFGLWASGRGATVWYVATTGADANDCLSPGTACLTIQSAHDRALDGDTIQIASGVYTQHTTISRSLLLHGVGQASTIIDGGGVDRVFTVTQGTSVTMAALTVSNGRAVYGGGIHNQGALTLQDCRVSDNSVNGPDGDEEDWIGGEGQGGGIFSIGVLSVDNCLLTGNLAAGGEGYLVGHGGDAYGGGIFSSGILTISESVVSDNSAVGGDGGEPGIAPIGSDGGHAYGGGVYSVGSFAVYTTTMITNTARGGDGMLAVGGMGNPCGGDGRGGAVFSNGLTAGSALVLDQNVAQGGTVMGFSLCSGQGLGLGWGGGLYGSGALTLENSQTISNTADWGGGASYSSWEAGTYSITVTNSVFSNNVAQDNGGAFNTLCLNTHTCSMLFAYVTASGNLADYGGGIDVFAGSFTNNTTTITHSTISSNTATSDGGGISSYEGAATMQMIMIVNSTMSGNTSGSRAGAVSAVGIRTQVQFVNATVISNSAPTAAGVWAEGPTGFSQVTFTNTLMANNQPSANCAVGSAGSLISNGHNLENGDSCNFTAAGDITNTNPLVGPLADNGGSTLTHALLSNSPALDAADDVVCQAPPVNGRDQRDVVRPLDGDGNGSAVCDIGAYEHTQVFRAYLPSIRRD